MPSRSADLLIVVRYGPTLILAALAAVSACRAENPRFTGATTASDGAAPAAPTDGSPSTTPTDRPPSPAQTDRPPSTLPTDGPPPDGPIDGRVSAIPLDAPVDQRAPLDVKPVDVASMDLAPNVMPMPDDSRYNFEQGEQDWHDLNRTAGTPPRRTTMRAFRGVGSLEVGLDLAAGADGRYVGVVPPSVMPGAGATITFRLWLPAGHKLIYVQPFILYFPTGARSSVWEGDSRPTAALPVESWFPLTVAVPATTDRIIQLGVHFKSIDGWRGTVWIDSVTW